MRIQTGAVLKLGPLLATLGGDIRKIKLNITIIAFMRRELAALGAALEIKY